jgi:hypothetical protein
MRVLVIFSYFIFEKKIDGEKWNQNGCEKRVSNASAKYFPGMASYGIPFP